MNTNREKKGSYVNITRHLPFFRGKNAQITLIIIFAILLVVSVGLLLYLNGREVSEDIKTEAKYAAQVPLEIEPVEQLISLCLDKAATDALELIGVQGGIIYKDQGGLSDETEVDFLTHNGNRVPYYIKKPLGRFGAYSSTIPDYPFWMPTSNQYFPFYLDLSSTDTHFVGYYGRSNPPSLKLGEKSIERQIESYVLNSIDKCVLPEDFPAFDMKLFGEVVINTTFNKNNVVVEMIYPLHIKKKDADVEADLYKFSTDLPVRLSVIKNFLNKVTAADISDISFDIETAFGDNMRVNVFRDISGNDDIIIISDDKSKLKSKAYEFIFARENRIPALYYIENPARLFHEGDLIDNTTLPNSNRAVDPDEDNNLMFYYTPSIIGPADIPPVSEPTRTINVLVNVTDGQYSDYQIIQLTTER